jgi:hypothetical protein
MIKPGRKQPFGLAVATWQFPANEENGARSDLRNDIWN